jgi:hypothetical protein
MNNLNTKALRAMGFLADNEDRFIRLWATDIHYISEKVGVRKIQDPLTGRFSLATMLDDQTKGDHINKLEFRQILGRFCP